MQNVGGNFGFSPPDDTKWTLAESGAHDRSNVRPTPRPRRWSTTSAAWGWYTFVTLAPTEAAISFAIDAITSAS
jgi:hypothetical protein